MENLLKVISRKKQKGNKKPKWGMRKLSKGLVSCLLGFSVLISSTTNVYSKVDWGTEGEGENPLKGVKVYAVKEGTAITADNVTITTPAKPKIDDVTENDKTISGKGVAGAKVNITKENADGSGGTEIVKDVEVRNDETWTAKVPDGVTLTKGDIIYATQKVDGKTVSDQAEATVKAADTQVKAPTLKANGDGSVTVTPPTDQDIDGVLITYIDENNHQGTLVVTKGDDGVWTLPKGTDPSIKIDKTTGVVTIPANQVKDGSEVIAEAEKDGTLSDEAKEKAKNNSVTKKVVTEWVQKTANGGKIVFKKQDGTHPDDDGVSDFPGYECVRIDKTEDATAITYTNVYKLLLGSKAVGLDGKELKPATIGYNEGKTQEFTGYTFLFDEAGSTPSDVQGKKAFLVNRIYAKNPVVVEVENPNSLTPDEQKAVKAAVKKANNDLLDKQISVNDKGEVTITRARKTAKLNPTLTVVKKGQIDAEKNDPKGQDISAKVGDTLKPEDGIKNKDDLTNVKSYTFKDPVDAKTPGKKDAVVVVKYNDGSEDKVDVKVNVKAWKDFFTAEGGELVVSKGTDVKAHDVYEKIKLIYNDQTFGVDDKNKIPLPIGNKSNAWLYVDSTKLPTKDSNAGQYNQNVFINYPDGSQQIVKVIVKVIKDQTDADKYTPTADAVEKEKGTAVTEKDIADAVKVPDFKENPKFHGQTPKVTVDEPSKLPDGNTVGTTNVAVTVTYPDGSTDKLTVPVTVKEKIADKVQPSYTEADAEVGKQTTITAPNFTDKDGKDTIRPEGTTFALGKGAPKGAEIDEDTGKITYTPTEDKAGQDVEIPVVVTYKDGSKDEVKATVTAAELDDIIDRTNDSTKPTPAGYVRVTFTNGEGVNNIENNKVYDVKEGTKLTADKYPKVTAKEGYGTPTWSTPAGTAITADNATITATATATTPAQKIATPSITEPKAGDIKVTGTATPGATVKVTLPDGTVKETKADDQGNWSVDTPALEKGQTVKVTATVNGKASSDEVTKTVAEATTPAQKIATPSITEPKAGDIKVTGTATPGATVKVTLPDGTVKETKADNQGNWSVDTPALEKDQTVKVTVTVDGKAPSDEATKTVAEAEKTADNNKTSKNLPKTGVESEAMMMAAAALSTLGGLYVSKKKKEDEE